ncbi:unnamed protein product [Ceutorhynchus assimilis]|uniref:C2H2-type domain-containing protein n=1 Tax=Ceutorhynchus assimilis TaxID=467358 RepID=A0A9N9MUQ2_9CUCU|nr:unnamed protein product [Ceutorhynchus assimilis]
MLFVAESIFGSGITFQYKIWPMTTYATKSEFETQEAKDHGGNGIFGHVPDLEKALLVGKEAQQESNDDENTNPEGHLNKHCGIPKVDDRFLCVICGKTFKKWIYLSQHLDQIHLRPRSFCCEFCGQRFNQNSSLKSHIHSKHIETRNFLCEICGRKFTTKITVERHIKLHDKKMNSAYQQLFQCVICDGVFLNKFSLKRHHINQHITDFVWPSCGLCGKMYYSTASVRFHIARFHGII